MKKGIISAVSAVLGAASGATACGTIVAKMKGKEIDQQRERAMKNAAVIDALARWISILQDGKSLSDYFVMRNYKTVVIYGYHYIGERLYRELEENDIEVKYAIDQNRNNVKAEIEVKSMEDDLEEADVVIVTPVFYFNSIAEKLEEVFDCPVVSFEEVLECMELR